MSFVRTVRLLLVGAVAAFTFTGATLPAVADASVQAPRVVTYDASQAAEFKDAIDQAAKVWNDSVHNARLEPASGRQADVTFSIEDGWPHAVPDGLGKGSVVIGRQAINEGYDKLRITTHELGHIYGLPDHRVPNCDELMSGHSAGTQCKNPRPNADEVKKVDENFAGGEATFRPLVRDAAGDYQLAP